MAKNTVKEAALSAIKDIVLDGKFDPSHFTVFSGGYSAWIGYNVGWEYFSVAFLAPENGLILKTRIVFDGDGSEHTARYELDGPATLSDAFEAIINNAVLAVFNLIPDE